MPSSCAHRRLLPSQWSSVAIDHLALEFGKRRPDGKLQEIADGFGAGEAREIEIDDVVGQDECAVNGILEFAHIPGPAMRADGQ